MYYYFRDGMLQATDVNPALAGTTTQDKTNPRIVKNAANAAKTTGEIVSGKKIKQISPLAFLAGSAAVIGLIGYLQRKK